MGRWSVALSDGPSPCRMVRRPIGWSVALSDGPSPCRMVRRPVGWSVALSDGPSPCRMVRRPVGWSVALSDGPSPCRMIRRPVGWSVALSDGPSPCRMVRRPVGWSVALSDGPSPCRMVRRPVGWSVALSDDPSPCRMIRRPVGWSVALSDGPSPCRMVRLAYWSSPLVHGHPHALWHQFLSHDRGTMSLNNTTDGSMPTRAAPVDSTSVYMLTTYTQASIIPINTVLALMALSEHLINFRYLITPGYRDMSDRDARTPFSISCSFSFLSTPVFTQKVNTDEKLLPAGSSFPPVKVTRIQAEKRNGEVRPSLSCRFIKTKVLFHNQINIFGSAELNLACTSWSINRGDLMNNVGKKVLCTNLCIYLSKVNYYNSSLMNGSATKISK